MVHSQEFSNAPGWSSFKTQCLFGTRCLFIRTQASEPRHLFGTRHLIEVLRCLLYLCTYLHTYLFFICSVSDVPDVATEKHQG